MLRFEFTSSQNPRIRSKPFKLFSDELPVIDFEKQHLLEKLADSNEAISAIMFKTANKPRKGHDSHSLPAIGEKDWDILSGSDRQSIKSESRLHGLNQNMQKIQEKIRERLGVKGTQEDHSPQFFEKSRHKIGELKAMPKPDEYKRFVEWPRLPTQQIVDQLDMQQNLLKYKERGAYVQGIQENKDYSLKPSLVSLSRLSQPRPKHQHGQTKHELAKDIDFKIDNATYLPTRVIKGKKKHLKVDHTEKKDTPRVPAETDKQEMHDSFKQAVSILKKRKDNDGSKVLQDSSTKINIPDITKSKPDSEQGDYTSNVLIHCDIPRRLLKSKRSVFNTYVGGVTSDDTKTVKRVNFIETINESSCEDLGSDKQAIVNKAVSLSTDVKESRILHKTETENHQANIEAKEHLNQLLKEPKLKHTMAETKVINGEAQSVNQIEKINSKVVSAYIVQRQDLDQAVKKHMLHEKLSKKRKVQNMMKHFRKIRGIQSVPAAINLKHKDSTTKPPAADTTETISKEKISTNIRSSLKPIPKISLSPSKLYEPLDSARNTVSSSSTISKGQGLNEDIETCVQIEKHHGVFKHHKKHKHKKIRVQSIKDAEDCSLSTDDEIAPETEIDRSMNGIELIKAYRLWNRKRKQFPGGIRKIDEPSNIKSVEHSSSMTQKKLNDLVSKLTTGSENEDYLTE